MKERINKVAKIKIGFIGGGGIAREHMKHLSEIEDVELVAVTDISKPALDLCQETYGIPHGFTNYKEMLEMDAIDAVTVGTPNSAHFEPTIDALRSGKDVLVEKPMAITAEEAAEMVKTSRDTDRLLVIGFQYRFSSEAQMLKRFIDRGEFGKILYGRCLALRRRGIPNWGVFGRKDLQGGGPLIDIGVHMIEAAHYLMGSPQPISAFGSTYTYLGDRPSETVSMWPDWDHKTYSVEDLAVGMIRFDNGATLSVESSFAAHIGKGEWNFSLMGEKSGGQYSPPMVFKDQSGTMINMTPEHLPDINPFRYKMEHFVECIKTRQPSEAPGEHGVLVQQILNGIYRSAETGTEVPIEPII